MNGPLKLAISAAAALGKRIPSIKVSPENRACRILPVDCDKGTVGLGPGTRRMVMSPIKTRNRKKIGCYFFTVCFKDNIIPFHTNIFILKKYLQ